MMFSLWVDSGPDRDHRLVQLIVLLDETKAIQAEEHIRCGKPRVFVAIDERLTFREVERIGGRHLEDVFVEILPAERLLGIATADSRRPRSRTPTSPPAWPRSIDFISSMGGVEELVLEYVSGFGDLAPLRQLKRLRSLHLENLRGVSDFSGLSGITGLKYLSVYGTTDWKQPIEDFEFLRGLPGLEVFALWEVITKRPYPALLPALSLKSLKKVRIHGSYFAAEEYALLEEGLIGVEGASWGPYRTVAYAQVELPRDDVRAHLPRDIIEANHPEVTVYYDGSRKIDEPASRWFEFTGKGAGRVKCDSGTAEARCREYADRYVALKRQARMLIDRRNVG